MRWKLVIIGVLSLSLNQAHAHQNKGIDSGGGMIVKDARNPWFVNNVREVTFCIDKAEHFEVSKSRLSLIIHRALDYWRAELSRAQVGSVPSRTSVQKFKIVPDNWYQHRSCSADTNVRFQFGVLHEDQKALLPNPKNFLAATIRTNYDRENLRGSGFVYVSPEEGPNHPEDENLYPRPWSLGDNNLLFATLVHEIGHILGIDHTNDDAGWEAFSLMGDRFVESLVNKHDIHRRETFYSPEKMIPFVSLPNNLAEKEISIGSCRLFEDAQKKFFKTENECLQFKYHSDNEIVIYSRARDVSGEEKLGKISFSRSFHGDRLETFVRFWLPPEQKVFDLHPNQPLGAQYRIAQRYAETAFKGVYSAEEDGLERSVVLRLSPLGAIKLDGILDGEIHMNLWSY